MMNKICQIATMVLLLSLHVSAQDVSTSEVAQKISKVVASVKSMQCDFVQTKQLKMMNDEMMSYGKLYYQQTGKMRWEYTSPYLYTFIINGSDVMIKKDNHTDKLSVNQSKVFKEITRIMMSCVLGKALSDEHSFKVSVASTQTEWVATMIPLNKDMRRMFYVITLHFNKQSSMMSSVELEELNGDITLIELQNVRTNVSLPVSIFNLD